MAVPLDLWATLLDASLQEIFDRVPCEVDRLRMRLVCKRWRDALKPLPNKVAPQLPWLLRPFHGGPAFSCLLGGAAGAGARGIHRLRVPASAPAARYFGSYEGRYLFLARGGTHDHALFNLRTGVSHPLPDEAPPFARGADGAIVMFAATLSSAPGHDRCVGAAIVRSEQIDNQIAFWHMGHHRALSPHDMVGAPWGVMAQDVVYHNGAFHVLTHMDGIVVCTPAFDHNGVLQRVHAEFRHFPHDLRAGDQDDCVRYGYLVVSRGELLLVVRKASDWKIVERRPRTSAWTFTVLRMTQHKTDGVDHYAWTEVPALDGRILFLGRGCSRSYEVVDFPGLQDGVFFLDDVYSYNSRRITQNLPYTCSDNGKWSRPPPVIERCFPPDQGTSNYSSPVWLLP